MAFVEPKQEATKQIVRVCGLFWNPHNYKPGMYAEEATYVPKEIKKFYDPKDVAPTEEALFAACMAHVKAHGWRLEPVGVEAIYRNFNKPIEPQMPALKAKLMELMNGHINSCYEVFNKRYGS